jgi:hypothetical protein
MHVGHGDYTLVHAIQYRMGNFTYAPISQSVRISASTIRDGGDHTKRHLPETQYIWSTPPKRRSLAENKEVIASMLLERVSCWTFVVPLPESKMGYIVHDEAPSPGDHLASSENPIRKPRYAE